MLAWDVVFFAYFAVALVEMFYSTASRFWHWP